MMDLHHQLEMWSANYHLYIYILKRVDLIDCLLYRIFNIKLFSNVINR